MLTKNPEGFRYDDDTHTYYIGDRRISGITEALTSVGLRPSLDHIPEPVLSKASRRGTHIHTLTQFLDEGRLGEVHESYAPYLDAYHAFKEEYKFVPEIIEEKYCHPIYYFAGRPDRGGYINGEKAVVEIKTIAGPLEDWIEFQLAGQQILFEDVAGFGQIKVRMAVKLKKDGTFDRRFFHNHKAKAMFLGAVSISNWKLGRA